MVLGRVLTYFLLETKHQITGPKNSQFTYCVIKMPGELNDLNRTNRLPSEDNNSMTKLDHYNRYKCSCTRINE